MPSYFSDRVFSKRLQKTRFPQWGEYKTSHQIVAQEARTLRRATREKKRKPDRCAKVRILRNQSLIPKRHQCVRATVFSPLRDEEKEEGR